MTKKKKEKKKKRGQLLANSQVETEVLSPIVLWELKFCQQTSEFRRNPFLVEPSDETSALDDILISAL